MLIDTSAPLAMTVPRDVVGSFLSILRLGQGALEFGHAQWIVDPLGAAFRLRGFHDGECFEDVALSDKTAWCAALETMQMPMSHQSLE